MLWATLPCFLATLVLPGFQGRPSAVAPGPLDSLRASIGRPVAEVEGGVAAVAFRDLATGDTLFVNADDSFRAASTMKVSVVIELFRRVDAGSLRLDQGIALANNVASIVDGPPYQLIADISRLVNAHASARSAR